jgi:hypothetical protein
VDAQGGFRLTVDDELLHDASTAPSFNGGKARSDRRGTTYTATADSNYSAIFLETPIDMEVIGGLKPAPTPPIE